MYRIGFPFWKFVAKRLGRISFRIEVIYDRDEKVFVATSPDLNGFVVEAATTDELVREANDVIHMLIREQLKDGTTKVDPVYKNLSSAIASV